MFGRKAPSPVHAPPSGAGRVAMLVGIFRWLFEDRRTGKIVIGQTPNAQLLLFILACTARAVARRSGPAGTTIRTVQAGSLVVWALDEFLRGVNPARRIGGALVIAATPFRRMLG